MSRHIIYSKPEEPVPPLPSKTLLTELQKADLVTRLCRFLLARCAADLKKDNEVETILRGPGGEVRKEV